MSLSEFADRFWTLSVWSFQSLLHIPLYLAILIFACLTIGLAFWKQHPFQNPLWKRSHWFVLTQLLFFPVVISLGVLYPASGPSFYHAQSVASRACGLLSWLSVALAGFWVYKMKGFRWFALSVVAVLEITLIGAFFISGMAISGDWL
ncbi:MAG: hypothetical protein ABSG16_13495 [Candidatus Acidiferrum sp.]